MKSVLRSGTLITVGCTSTAASCGLVAGGWHGVLFATLLFTAMGGLGMLIAVVAAAALDSSRAVKEGLHGAPVVRGEVLERGAGQLSVSAPTSGALAHTVGSPPAPPPPRVTGPEPAAE